MSSIETTPALVARVYERLARNVEVARRRLERPLTYAEKIFLGHFADPESESLEPGRSRSASLIPSSSPI
jgi:aconitate hydratase